MNADKLLEVINKNDTSADCKDFLDGQISSLALGINARELACEDEDGDPSDWAFRCGWLYGELLKASNRG